jgi:hypothetical protein
MDTQGAATDPTADAARAMAVQLAEAAYIGHCHATRRKPIAFHKLEPREHAVWLATARRVAKVVATVVAEQCATIAENVEVPFGREDGEWFAAEAIRKAFPKD